MVKQGGIWGAGLLTWAVLSVSCTPSAPKVEHQAAEPACERLKAATGRLHAQLDALAAVPPSVPTDVASRAEAVEAQLVAFGQAFAKVQEELDQAHAEHEQQCKVARIAEDDFDAVMTTVYRPHIEVVGKQRRLLLQMAARLDQVTPPSVAALAAAYRNAAQVLAQGLRAQIDVCVSDFDKERCRDFRNAVEEVLRTPARPRSPTANPETNPR